MLAGPSETGKTFATLWRLDSECRRWPGGRFAIVRKVAADLNTTVLETWRRVIAIRGGVETFGGQHPEWYDYPNGARVYVGGMDRPGKVLSGERDAIYFNQAEEADIGDWETLTTRTTGRGAVTEHPMLFGDCNPGPPTHWILHRPRLRVMESRHEDNPSLFDEDGWPTRQWTEGTGPALDALTGVRKERLRHGRWVAAEGTVYEFDRAHHRLRRDELPPIVDHVCGIDFGFSNPFVWSLWGVDADGRLYLLRQIYRTQRLVEDHARAIRGHLGDVRPSAWICDHDAEGRATLERHLGISTTPAFKSVQVGIQAVQSRLKLAGDGRPRLFILEDALVERDEALAALHRPVCTLDEFELYSWPKAGDGRVVKEEPVKEHDHGMDEMRYVVAYLDGLRAETKEPGWRDLARTVMAGRS